MKILMIILLFIMTLFLLGYYLNRSRPQLGVFKGKLLPCIPRPNCVSSFSSDPKHTIKPLPYIDEAGLKQILLSLPRSTLIIDQEGYIYVEYRSKWLSFVDDAEFLMNEVQKQIDVRSGARVGYSDFGVNRHRIETIRKKIEEMAANGV